MDVSKFFISGGVNWFTDERDSGVGIFIINCFLEFLNDMISSLLNLGEKPLNLLSLTHSSQSEDSGSHLFASFTKLKKLIPE
jgi:hypothetical protein